MASTVREKVVSMRRYYIDENKKTGLRAIKNIPRFFYQGGPTDAPTIVLAEVARVLSLIGAASLMESLLNRRLIIRQSGRRRSR